MKSWKERCKPLPEPRTVVPYKEFEEHRAKAEKDDRERIIDRLLGQADKLDL